MVLPLSIPSPNSDWQSVNVGDWIRGIGFKAFSFDITIHSYAICILLGIVIALVITHLRLTARGAQPGVVLDVGMWAVVSGIAGARIFHVLTHPTDYFGAGKNLWAVFFVWEGGIAIFGALIGGAIGAFIACRISGLRFWSFVDALAPGLLLAQAFGRFGNYFNHELFGLPTTAWWGLQIEASNPSFPIGLPAGTLFQPMFLFEFLWNTAGALVILYLSKKFTLQWGKTFAVYLIWYGVGRSYFESIRIDPSLIFWGVRTNIWAAAAAVLLGVIIFVLQSRRHTGLEPSVYLPNRQWTPPAAVESTDIYSDFDEPEPHGGANADATEESSDSKMVKSVKSATS